MRMALSVIGSLLSLLIAVYAVGIYGFGPGAEYLPSAFRASFRARSFAFSTHIYASATALLLGPIQFSASLRMSRPVVHRSVGRIYLIVAVPIGGLAGLYLSGFAFGGIVTKLGFGCLSVLWLFTAFQGYRSARSRDFSAHRRWMIRNYALTFAAVTLRLYLLPSLFLRVPFVPSYQVVSWLCWVPNLLAAESYLRRTSESPSLEPSTARSES
ncbi:MAG: DUF2306 domain-containing protein [Isosphaeraceae bacterium]|nr:DUF2306 domain-containing protein [Isosphaeraceae bacterium]